MPQKGINLKWGFAKMSRASKEWLLGSNSLISRHIFNFDCWECMYYVQVTAFIYRNFIFKSWIATLQECIANFKCITLIRSLFFVLEVLKRLNLFGNKSLESLVRRLFPCRSLDNVCFSFSGLT